MKNNSENIQAELADLGLTLEHRPSMPLQVPDGYFAASKQDMMHTISALDFLENLPKKMPQDVPAAYFEQSKKEILAKVTASEPKPTLTFSRRSNKKSWLLAATMALLISIGLFFMDNNATKSPSLENQLSSLSAEEVNGYIENKAYEFEAWDILENPQLTSKKMEDLEAEILNATKSMSDEELFVYVL